MQPSHTAALGLLLNSTYSDKWGFNPSGQDLILKSSFPSLSQAISRQQLTPLENLWFKLSSALLG